MLALLLFRLFVPWAGVGMFVLCFGCFGWLFFLFVGVFFLHCSSIFDLSERERERERDFRVKL